MFKKFGELIEISRVENTASCIPAVSPEILENFKKIAINLKKIAPKAEDFLYFSAIMMHAAEAAGLNDDGTNKLTIKGEPVQVGWDRSGNTWRWMSNDPSVKPYKNCFPPGTKILMSNGSVKNIENIESGDKVITHTGKSKKVLRKFITPHNDNLLELTINNNIKILTTNNHPFYTLNISNENWNDKTSSFRLWNEKNTLKKYSFISAESLDKENFLLSINPSKRVHSKLNEDKARLLGLYAAEGSLNKSNGKYRNSVTFTFSNKEYESLGLLTKKILEKEFNNINVTVSVNEKNHKCTVIAYKKDIYKFFKKYVGEYSHAKCLHSELVFGSSKIKEQFILGWLEVDGNISKDTKRITGTTVSPNLASQIRLMLYSLGIHNTLYEVPPSNSVINGRNIVGKHNVYRLRINSTNGQKLIKNSNKLSLIKDSKARNLNKFIDNFCIHRILNKKDVAYNGYVYNLEVEDDHSYIANWMVVSNCNGDIFPEEELVKAHKKWIGKPLCIDHKSSSVDHTRGFIVDTYYDRDLKRVIALCALDKANYPELARKISSLMQTSVSMGTAVGRAICSDCARVARTEADFCDHMRRKSCYGEINVDLNPIELSIVVNGADPKANIKHIIAAANTLNTYVENKQKELNKLSENFVANLSFTKGEGNRYADEGGLITNVQVNSKDLETFRKDVDKAIADFQKLQSSLLNEENIQEHGNDMASDQLSDSSMLDTPAADSGLAPPHARFAATEDDVGVNPITELREVTKTIEAKLSQMKQSLDKLSNTSTNKQEENMSGSFNEINKKGYYQGGGGVNEPTPGQAKYPKDPLNEKLRDSEDKQMVGQNGFPGVGPVDGMHASPDSADQSNELERKKMLARAESEERAIRRNAIVNLAKQALENKKEAYFQGGGGVNEPTPGKVKYPKDKLNEDLRDSEDKQMVGQKPFPGVGPVDGLHPSPSSADVADELKRKEMLRRASLKARFVKASNEDGTQNLGKSAWEVFLGDKLLLTASVNDLSGGRAEILYDSIATKDFGTQLISKVKSHGADKVRSLVKSGQEAAPPAAAPAPAAPEMAAPGDVGAEDTGKSGDPKDAAAELAEKVRDLSSDLVEAVRALTGEQAEMGDMDSTPAPEIGATAGNFSSETLNTLRKELNGSLTNAMKESVAALNDHQQELEMISGLYDKGAVTSSNADFVGNIVEDALNEAKTAVADGFKLMTAFVKYARGTKAIVKRAQMEAELEALGAEGDNMTGEHDTNSDDDLMNLINNTNDDLNDIKELMSDDNDHMGEESHDDSELSKLLGDEACMPADDNDMKVEVKPGEEVPPGLPPKTTLVTASFNSKEGRAALRAKLAADALGKEESGEIQDMSKAKFSDMLDQADGLADGQTELDTKPSDDLGRVETLPELNKAMMDVAKAPPKVRKEAEAIYKLVSEGKLDPADLDELVAQGLDKDAVAYYKKYWGQTDGGSEFASELVKEHVKAQMEEELNKYRVKLARAYELAYDMVDRGICHHDRNSVSAQVDEIMKFNDDGFDSLKRVIARHPVTNSRVKEAGRMPQVGMIGSGEVNTVATDDNLYSQLSAAFSKTSKRSF